MQPVLITMEGGSKAQIRKLLEAGESGTVLTSQ